MLDIDGILKSENPNLSLALDSRFKATRPPIDDEFNDSIYSCAHATVYQLLASAYPNMTEVLDRARVVNSQVDRTDESKEKYRKTDLKGELLNAFQADMKATLS